MRRRTLTVCVSGPDGAGKSTLAGRLAAALRERGYTVATPYCHGCVVCRRLPSGARFRFTASGGQHGTIASGVGRGHAWIDTMTLAVRLTAARLRARLTARGRPTAVVTDRGPLDTLVKFDPAPRSALAAVLNRLLRSCRATLLLDTGPEVLAERDGEYPVGPLAALRARYRRRAEGLPVQTLDATAPPPLVEAEALRVIPARPADRRKHIVISIFDDFGNRHYHGGGAVLVEKLARCLAAEHRVTVVTVARRGGSEIRDGVEYRTLPVGLAGPRLGQLLYHALLPLTALRIRHDIWLESFTPPFSTGFLPLFTRSPVIGIAQSLSGATMSRKYHLPFFLVERLGLKCYDDVVVLNEADGAAVRRHAPQAVTHVISNGVEQPAGVPERIGEGDYIAFLGRVSVWEKGLDLLLAAHRKAASGMPLLLAGAGLPTEEARLAELLDETGADAHWVGQVSGARKSRFLEDCAFMVVPSRSEAFGLVALESMAYGKPVLHFDLPTLRWMDGGDITVPAFDVDALARQLNRLAADADRRRRLGQQAYRAARQYSWERTTDRYRALVRQVMEPSGPPGTSTGLQRIEVTS